MPWTHRTLVAGETVEIPETGVRFFVERVGAGGATVRPLAVEPETVQIHEVQDGKRVLVREFTATRTGHRQEWSPRAIVRHLS